MLKTESITKEWGNCLYDNANGWGGRDSSTQTYYLFIQNSYIIRERTPGPE